MSQNPADSVVKKVALLKELTDNPDSKVTDIAKEVGISKSTAYTILQEFSKAFGMSPISYHYIYILIYNGV